MRLQIVYLLFLTLWISCDSSDTESISSPTDALPMHEQKFDALVRTYENRDRDSWQQPEKVIAALGDVSQKTVVDLGAGSGYFCLRLLPHAQKVIALEIDSRFVSYLEDKSRDLPDSLSNRLDIRLAEVSDPHLQPAEADAILVVNTYIYMQDRVAYFSNLRSRIKPGGQLLIVDFHKKPQKLGPPLEHKVAPHTITEELVEAGYSDITVDSQTLPYQYMVSARMQ